MKKKLTVRGSVDCFDEVPFILENYLSIKNDLHFSNVTSDIIMKEIVIIFYNEDDEVIYFKSNSSIR